MRNICILSLMIMIGAMCGCTTFETDKEDPFTADEALNPGQVITQDIPKYPYDGPMQKENEEVEKTLIDKLGEVITDGLVNQVPPGVVIEPAAGEAKNIAKPVMFHPPVRPLPHRPSVHLPWKDLKKFVPKDFPGPVDEERELETIIELVCDGEGHSIVVPFLGPIRVPCPCDLREVNSESVDPSELVVTGPSPDSYLGWYEIYSVCLDPNSEAVADNPWEGWYYRTQYVNYADSVCLGEPGGWCNNPDCPTYVPAPLRDYHGPVKTHCTAGQKHYVPNPEKIKGLAPWFGLLGTSFPGDNHFVPSHPWSSSDRVYNYIPEADVAGMDDPTVV